MREVTIAEAATCLGVSVDTVRRRIGKGELKYRKVSSPHGEMYMIEISEDNAPLNEPPRAVPVNNPEIDALHQTISILQTELEARRREISELHILLQRASLPSPGPEGIPWWRRIFPWVHKRS
jgi:excisionase family DNA binding protein